MVLSSSPADHQSRPGVAPWIELLQKRLALAGRGMILLVDQAADNQLGTLVRALYPEYPNLYVLNGASDIEDCPSNATIVLIPRPSDANTAQPSPKDRGELYEKCVEMLLKTWQEAKRKEGEGPRGMEGLHLHVPTQKDYLGHLAFYVQQKTQGDKDEDARGLVSRNEALNILTTRHLSKAQRDRPKLSQAEARAEMERFFDYVCDETGLLIDRGNDQLSFIHLSFQEYLAAWVFVQGTDLPRGPEFFVEHLGDPAWEEVLLLRLYIVLRAGGGGESEFDRIVEALFQALRQTDSPGGWMTLMRAVRDDLDFSEQDRRIILQHALLVWVEDMDFYGPWFNLIEEVVLFGPRGYRTLRELLLQMRTDPDAKSIHVSACWHLENKLFPTPSPPPANPPR